jgi:hypothetical protein
MSAVDFFELGKYFAVSYLLKTATNGGQATLPFIPFMEIY